MPVQEHPDQVFSFTESHNDVAWMNLVLSPPSADVPSLGVLPVIVIASPAFEPELDLPASSFRLQILRAWIAASGSCPARAPGHA